ncbi:unnamed protein product [Staurois parvus]|uniref:Uncharacterized protein n=1 Tax=Staurois parvus TaxID=386267 RepID=A0ABN9FJS3_9NEOB|nr:unnamed protein product [Staurois parvus]
MCAKSHIIPTLREMGCSLDHAIRRTRGGLTIWKLEHCPRARGQ